MSAIELHLSKGNLSEGRVGFPDQFAAWSTYMNPYNSGEVQEQGRKKLIELGILKDTIENNQESDI